MLIPFLGVSMQIGGRVGDLRVSSALRMLRFLFQERKIPGGPSGAFRGVLSRSIDGAADEKFEREMKCVIYCDFTRSTGRQTFSRSIDREILASEKTERVSASVSLLVLFFN